MQHTNRTFVPVDGLDIACATVGEGPPVVFIHGAITTLEDGLIALEDELAGEFALTAFDRPGHGASGRDGSTGSAWRQAEIIHATFAGLKIERPVVVGHSFGGAVAMAMAMLFPDDVAGVVAVGPIAFPEPRLEIGLLGPRALPVTGDWQAMMSRSSDAVLMPLLYRAMFLPQQMPPAFAHGFPFALGGGMTQLQADGQDALAMIDSLTRSALRYSDCHTPVHVMHGDRDLVANPMLHARPLARVLPNSELTVLPGLGHMAHHFAPAVVADAVRRLAGAETKTPVAKRA